MNGLVLGRAWRYRFGVNLRIVSYRRIGIFVALFTLLHNNIFAQTREIHLRRQTIITTHSAAASKLARISTPESRISGLYLIQFTGHLEPEWKDQLSALRVELLRYAADDSFICRFSGVNTGMVQSLPFVQWVGPYKPEYKLHASIDPNVPGKFSAATNVPVSILLAPSTTPSQLSAIKPLLSTLRQESHLRQGIVLRGVLPSGRINALAQSDAVLWVEPAPHFKISDEVSSKIVGGEDGEVGTRTTTQQLGYTGAGVTVAVADTGLNNGDAASMHPDLFGRVTAFKYYGALDNAADEHSHGTHVTGIIAANAATGETDENGALYGLGVAPEANIVVQRIFDGEGNFEAPPSNETLTRDAVRAGAQIGSNSWGDDTQGRYDISASEFDELVRDADALSLGDQPYILEFSAGNAGPGLQTMDSPAVAKNVIATGASDNDRPDLFIYADGIDAMADFSSRGPCEDGRIKPDVVAPGTWIASTKSASAGDENAWSPISDYYMYQGGTSQAGPHVSGAAAVFAQYYKSLHTNAVPSPALVKAALINSAVDMDDSYGTGPIPNSDEGWGRIDLTELIGSPKSYEFVDQTSLLASGQVYEQRTFIRDSNEPLKITLAYTDVPGFPGAIPALVNDLDLEVIGPDGSIYRGNQMEDGESVPNAPSSDSINNVEAVHLAEPQAGEYVIRVRARNVAQDARLDSQAVDQDFALVVSGDIPNPGEGVIVMDRGAYTAPGKIAVKVVDTDQAGRPSVNALISGTTEPLGESLLLSASSGGGVFTGMIATATGPAMSDGVLEIHHGDVIEARYTDVSSGVTRSAMAIGDLMPPVISSVSTTNQFGRVVVNWHTDEPSDSIVRYGTNTVLSISVTNPALVTDHSASISGLKTGAQYKFLVSSADQAGNRSTNDNSGALYTFIGVPTSTILVVDAYVPDSDSQTIPVSEYTDAIAAAGFSFDVWNVSSLGSPKLDDLKPFPVVMWRVSDSIYTESSYSTLSGSQQGVIQSYVGSGGSFFMSSMEILSRLGDVPFRRNVFNVASFAVNDNPFDVCTDCDEDVGVSAITGVPNDPITGGIDVDLDYGAYPTIDFLGLGPDFSDTFTPGTNAAPIIINSDNGKFSGMRAPLNGLDTDGRVVFLSFPIDTVPMDGAEPNNRVALFHNIINYLAPGANGVGSVSFDRKLYNLPSQVRIEVGDSDLAGAGATTVTMFSSYGSSLTNVVLNETVRKGLFRGYVTLVPTNAPPGTNQLAVRDGDTFTVAYYDASSMQSVMTMAIVDTTPPVISDITADTGYQEASISWETSKEADSLVQFGESILLGRSAYAGDFNTSHFVSIGGLLPDKTYYYEVVSRDAAGNTAVDDNNGQFYTFRTLKPLELPWFDDLESNSNNWTVYNADGSETGWTLGVPNNGVETNAHSPLNAWGSNLNGDSISEVETFLISPAINLTGGNAAKLSFWHSFDFTPLSESDLFEYGEVMIITNAASAPVPLAEYDEYSDGWEQADPIDLTPYIGHAVYLVWHYVEFSFDNYPRPGWLVDDIGVSISTVVPGTIVVTNNLSESSFVLTGPASRSGHGLASVITNIPPGFYSIQYGDVPFYQTPPVQSGTLDSTATLGFGGNYTFSDANTNGISDDWEQQYFGSVSSGRTRLTDSDGDGMSDYAEFIAGTNPTNAASKLAFFPSVQVTNGVFKLQWAASPGRAYQLEASPNMTQWTPITDWLRAVGSPMMFTGTNGNSSSMLYRLKVRP